jgi:protein involved in sex pheromone biosynthesis
MKKQLSIIALAVASMMLISACAPEVGSKEWCENMKQKDKGDWTANEVADFAKHCIF